MNIFKLHKLIGCLCIAAVFILIGVASVYDSDVQRKFGVYIAFFVPGIYLPFYCCLCIKTGEEKWFFIGAGTTNRKESPFLFWFVIFSILVVSVSFLWLPFM